MTKRMDALKVALNNEMKEHEFYLKNAERTKNAVGKAMFTQIAGEELEHHEIIQEELLLQEEVEVLVVLEQQEVVVLEVMVDQVQEIVLQSIGVLLVPVL